MANKAYILLDLSKEQTELLIFFSKNSQAPRWDFNQAGNMYFQLVASEPREYREIKPNSSLACATHFLPL